MRLDWISGASALHTRAAPSAREAAQHEAVLASLSASTEDNLLLRQLHHALAFSLPSSSAQVAQHSRCPPSAPPI